MRNLKELLVEGEGAAKSGPDCLICGRTWSWLSYMYHNLVLTVLCMSESDPDCLIYAAESGPDCLICDLKELRVEGEGAVEEEQREVLVLTVLYVFADLNLSS